MVHKTIFSWLATEIAKYLLSKCKSSLEGVLIIQSNSSNKMFFHAKYAPRLGTFSLQEVYSNNKIKCENI